MTDPTDETRPDRDALRKAITDSYYETRNEGGTMETAADRAADAVLALLPARDAAVAEAAALRAKVERLELRDAEMRAAAEQRQRTYDAPAPHPQGGTEALRRIEVLTDDLVDRLGGIQGLLSSDLEAAYQMGQSDGQKQAISDMGGRVNAAWGLAVDIREAVAGRSMPSFEDLLRDPTQQLDREGVVLQSILDYQRRNPSTTALCLTPIPLASPTTASVGLPSTGSVYVCTKQKPCPDHPALLAAAPAPTEGEVRCIRPEPGARNYPPGQDGPQ